LTESAPLVSIVVPAYNAAATLAETIESVLSQRYAPIELIVVDDGSTDDSSTIARRFEPHLRYIRQENSGGCATPRNIGLELSQGAFVGFLDADDLLTEDHVANLADLLVRRSDVGLVFSNYRNFPTSDLGPRDHFSTCPELSLLLGNRDELVLEHAMALLARENFGIASSFLVRRELAREIEAFDQTLLASEDFHFFYRIARHTPIGVVRKVSMLRRLHAHNMSADPEKMLREGFRARHMLFETETDVAARANLLEYLACFKRDWGRLKANHRKLPSALRHYAESLSYDRSMRALSEAGYGAIRAVAVALGIHRPDGHGQPRRQDWNDLNQYRVLRK